MKYLIAIKKANTVTMCMHLLCLDAIVKGIQNAKRYAISEMLS